MRRIAPALLLPVLLVACGGEEGDDAATPSGEPAAEAATPETPPTDPREVAFAPSLDVDLAAMERRESGLYVQVLEEGEGARAEPGDSMFVHYTVWFADGRQLDSSLDRRPPQPLPMALGETLLIDGWTEGVTGMRVGERRRLVVPYDLGYGEAGRPPRVPPYSTLVFEVERMPAGGS